jgi:parallel beta-helix repeat protein
MRKLILLILCVVSVLSCAYAEGDEINLYVSPKGNDANPGTKELPLASIESAKMHVRQIKSSTKGNIIVWLRGGNYELGETLVFGLEDSGEGDQTISYRAYTGETPVLSSGHEVKDWKKVKGNLPGLPESAQGKVMVADVSDSFRTLYDDEGILPRARSAKFIPLEGGSRNQIHCPEGLLKNWSNVEDVEMVVRPHHAWIMNILPLVSVDVESQVATTGIDATYAMNYLHFLKTTESCWLENVLEELDEPGEWVLNTKEGKLYLWPRSTSKVVAPKLFELIRVEGKIDKEGPMDIPVRNLQFCGLTFKHGERYSLTPDDAGLQHDWDMLDKNNALVRFRGTENCVIEQCHFLHSGSGAIRVDLYGQNNTISSNHIEHMGGGGILLCGYGPGTKDVNKNNLIYNNNIHHVGEIYWHSSGIFLWQSGGNRVANNLIHHTNYTGLILSGCMTDFFIKKGGRELARTFRRNEMGDLHSKPTIDDVRSFLHTKNNLIEYNEIHNVMEKMGDGNAIYIRGAGADNVFHGNYIHHLVTPMIMQCAIRTDGGQMDTYFTNNLIYKCASQGVMLKLNNHCENNIVADVLEPPRGYYLSLREGPMTGATIKRNIFYSSKKVVEFINEIKPGKKSLSEDGRGRPIARSIEADTDFNIYFCKADNELGKSFLKKQQDSGIEANSQSVDPMFVDPENGDFSFKPDSPALKMGIVPFDMSKVGLRTVKE